MALLPQDVVVALKLALAEEEYPYAQIAHELGLSASQAHYAVQRAVEAGLVAPRSRKVNRQALVEFLVHGLKYVYPAKKGHMARGVPTAHAAPPLRDLIADGGSPLVWEDPEGKVRGEVVEPLHKSVPMAARRDKKLYASLALIDAIRVGRARERKLAKKKLEELLLDAP